jgi:hypothetical protein
MNRVVLAGPILLDGEGHITVIGGGLHSTLTGEQ